MCLLLPLIYREGNNEESKCMTKNYIMVSVLNEHAGTLNVTVHQLLGVVAF